MKIEVLDHTVYALPNRILIYMSKFTPIFISTMVYTVVSFFTDRKNHNLKNADPLELDLDDDEMVSQRSVSWNDFE